MNNIDELARTYSEGSNELYKCLLELWKNDFETIGCCKGHDNHVQYIGLNRNDNNKIVKFLSVLNKDDIIISFLNNHISIKKNKNRDIYDSISDSIKQMNENNSIVIDTEIKNSIDFIDNNNYKYVNIHHYYFKGILQKYINTSDLDLINILKEKYEYKVLNKKLPMYHFIIK
jgi:hypothetical protein